MNKTILCPNCNKPFVLKYGKLYCAEHGWHELNELQEVVPADEPTPEEIGHFVKLKADHSGDRNYVINNEPQDLPVSDQVDDRDYSVAYDTQVLLVMSAVCGIGAIVVLAGTFLKQQHQKRKKVIAHEVQ